jgi:drug/metabolite transporter (DMT)-like permease
MILASQKEEVVSVMPVIILTSDNAFQNLYLEVYIRSMVCCQKKDCLVERRDFSKKMAKTRQPAGMKERRNGRKMDTRTLRSNTLLMLTAMIWGFAFVAQRIGMDHVGPFTFNGIRFAMGGLSLIPVMIVTGRPHRDVRHPSPRSGTKTLLTGGVLAGAALFTGASLQQVGLMYTTAGKAGFITGLYVVLVPIVGLIWRQHADTGTWLGALLAATGLYFLSVTEQFTISFGDFLELLGALVWACHVLLIGWFSPKISAIRLSFIQFMVCSALSLVAAAITETVTAEGLRGAAPAILYGGLGSVGIAYTLQVVAQKHARATTWRV